MRAGSTIILALYISLLSALSIFTAQATEKRSVAIGTGDVTGVYFPAGGAICRLINNGRTDHGIRCAVEPTSGSIQNINRIRSGDLEFGIVQSDWQYHAYYGTGKFGDSKPFDELRAIFSLHPEPVTIVARADAGIHEITDLLGKRLNVDLPESGTRNTWNVIAMAYGWDDEHFDIRETKAFEASKALCKGEIDAFVALVGHPSTLVKDTLRACDSVLVNITGKEIDELVARYSFYRYAIIPAGAYEKTDGDTKSFGVGATFVTTSYIPKEVVYGVVKNLMSKIDTFRKLHPALEYLEPRVMANDSLTAPYHAGAEEAYRELGLID
jgi:uncharacterized protein